MYTGRRFTLWATLPWSWRGGAATGALALAVAVCHAVLGLDWMQLPAMPVGVLGTAVAFYLGFKGNAAYDRLWEGRKIWGGIVNSSRTWAVFVRTMVTDLHEPTSDVPVEDVHRELILRQVAWLAALRTQLRRRKPWEHDARSNNAYRAQTGNLDMSPARMRQRLTPYVSVDELEAVMENKNQATQLLRRQAERLTELYADRRIEDFRHMELAGLIETFYTLQGQCERIKNFPLPRQYATANHWFVTAFLVLLPFAIAGAFSTAQFRPEAVWITVPLSMLIGWVFYTWDMVVEYTENPFEGLINDVPMDALSRTIEIDLLEMLGDTELPPALGPNDHQTLY